jgi:hypothetical protein
LLKNNANPGWPKQSAATNARAQSVCFGLMNQLRNLLSFAGLAKTKTPWF